VRAGPRLAVTLGDPRGIGPEVVRGALAEPIGAHVTLVGAEEQVATIAADAKVSVGSWKGSAGRDADRGAALRAGQLAGHALERAVRLALDGQVDGVVTGPVEKHALHAAGFRYPGQTEWLGALAGGVEVAMMLAAGPLRVVLVTTHVALRDVPALLTTDRVVRIARLTRKALVEQFGMAAPRLALCALNPHAGEQGLFGDEEARVLGPAAAQAGLVGPLPADTVFVRALRGEFDAVLAPYHDVGMTAIKVAAFGRGVNITLGLPFVRTSPDHGTAFDIAGQGRADPASMRQALELAVALTAPRPPASPS